MGERLPIMVRQVLRDAFAYCRKDVLIVTPFLFFSFVIHFLDQWTTPVYVKGMEMMPFLWRYLGERWLFGLVISSLTIAMALQLFAEERVQVGEAMKRLFKSLGALIVATSIVAIPEAWLGYEFITNVITEEGRLTPDLAWVVIAMFVLKIVLLYVPILILSERLNVWRAYKESFRLVKTYFRETIIFLCFNFGILFAGTFLTGMMQAIPVIGPGLLYIVMLGGTYALMTVFLVAMYRAIRSAV